ncbi:YihY/virulence factor BrkB family protein [Nucisporomicrobium flavum]|uniref:YihY/virulence factor BrkB family protein n=1 Tax=Nucisporomicrobium flavum TaxID=2785915 RepID=UPI0027DB50AD|nr:YhjD/YihY/BrkB family envelope integrity protein [Nucisporomicrobium flavum]
MDRLQRRHGVLGFAYAVARKFLDDGGGREAALITYYGFLSIFPLLLIGVAVVSRVLTSEPELRQRLVTAIVPPSLQPTVEGAAAALPSSTAGLAAGLVGLLFSAAGVVFSGSCTLNHLAAVPFRARTGTVLGYLRMLLVLVLIIAGAVAVGGLTVVATVVPGLPGLSRAFAVLGSGLVVLGVLLASARLLLFCRAPVRALWPAAVPGAVAVTVVLNVGAAVLPGLVRRAGAVYGGFATVAGMFTMLYVLSIVLVCSAEIAAVRRARLWPRALDPSRPTAADARALALLAREQERTALDRVSSRVLRPEGGTPPPPTDDVGRGDRARRS